VLYNCVIFCIYSVSHDVCTRKTSRKYVL